jgi:hypothetical protein
MAYDVYAAARALRDELDSSGHRDWSGEIQDAVEGGSTGTEILMRLRWVVTRLASALHAESPRAAAQAREIETEINRLIP